MFYVTKMKECREKNVCPFLLLKSPRPFSPSQGPQTSYQPCFFYYAKAFDCVDHNKLWKILQEMGIPDHLTCLLQNLYAGQEAPGKHRYGTMDGSKLGKEYVKAVY